MERKAKIVATLGPASDTLEKIVELIKAGLNVARINMSHGTYEAHGKVIKNIREASKIANQEVAILLDLQGPKIRVDKLPQPLVLKENEEWVIGATKVKSKYPQYETKFIPTVYENLVADARVGCTILFDDGLMEAKAIAKEDDVLKIKIKVGGELKSNKGINLPDVNVSAPSFTAKDKADLMFGLENGIDYIALSFIRTKQDIMEVKYLLHKLKLSIPIVSKIEKPEAIKNIEEIIEATDVIMIARGDMGVEIGNHLVPSVQKRIINLCNAAGVPVITATQMLESMSTNARPTRAEASDVANAIWDGTDAVMLSGETASGKYPIEAIQMMDNIILEAEKTPKDRPPLRFINIKNVSAANQVAVSMISEKINAKWIIAITQSGDSCWTLSQFRPKVIALGVTHSLPKIRKLCLLWGIHPLLIQEKAESAQDLEFLIIEKLKKEKMIENGDKLVISRGSGDYFSREISNSIRVEIVKDAPNLNATNEVQKVEFDKGTILFDPNVCAGCQVCQKVCPHDIWTLTTDEKARTVVDESKVKHCTLDMECVTHCPSGAIEIISKV